MGLPSASTTRPTSSRPTGMGCDRASCRLTFGEVLIVPQHHGAYGVALRFRADKPRRELDHLPIAGFCHAESG